MADKKLYVGIDIGGTNVTLAARDDASPFLEELVTSQKADLSNDGAFTEQIRGLRQKLVEKIEGASINDIVFYGIGSTGQPTPEGTITGSSNRSFEMTFAPKLFGEVRKHFRIVNDVAVAAYGAKDYGYGNTKFKNQGSPRWDAAMTIGTGTNIQILMNGELLCNQYGQSFEFGHIKSHDRFTGDLCGDGARGCGEAYFAGAGIQSRAAKRLVELYKQHYKGNADLMLPKERILQEASKRMNNTKIGDLILGVTAEDVFNAYANSKMSDKTAAQIVNEGIDALAEYFGNAMNALPAIPYVEVFGGITENNPWFVPQTVAKLEQTPAYWGNRNPLDPNSTKFLVTYVDRLGLKGAVALAYYEGQKKLQRQQT